MRLFWTEFFKSDRSNDNTIVVQDPSFNPTKELIDTLKNRITDLLEVVQSKNIEIEELRRENLNLRENIIKAPSVPKPPTQRHYITTSAAKTELERRSLELKRNSETKKSASN